MLVCNDSTQRLNGLAWSKMKWFPSFILIATILSLTQTAVSARWIEGSQAVSGFPEAAKRAAGFVGMRGKKADESMELEAGPHEDQFEEMPEAGFIFSATHRKSNICIFLKLSNASFLSL